MVKVVFGRLETSFATVLSWIIGGDSARFAGTDEYEGAVAFWVSNKWVLIGISFGVARLTAGPLGGSVPV